MLREGVVWSFLCKDKELQFKLGLRPEMLRPKRKNFFFFPKIVNNFSGVQILDLMSILFLLNA